MEAAGSMMFSGNDENVGMTRARCLWGDKAMKSCETWTVKGLGKPCTRVSSFFCG